VREKEKEKEKERKEVEKKERINGLRWQQVKANVNGMRSTKTEEKESERRKSEGVRPVSLLSLLSSFTLELSSV